MKKALGSIKKSSEGPTHYSIVFPGFWPGETYTTKKRAREVLQEYRKSCKLKRSQFTIDDHIKYWGWTFGNHWNGWACPLFDKSVGDAICKEMSKAPDMKVYYDATRDAFVEEYDGNKTYFESIQLTINGVPMLLYPIGAQCWVWEDVQEY